MKGTLYSRCKEIEGHSRSLKLLNSSLQIDVEGMQKKLFSEYEDNPVFTDALKGIISVEDSLNELLYVKRPVRRLFPVRKNKAHNQRLGHIGELITKPEHLETRGLMCPDNFLIGMGGMTFLSYSLTYVVSSLIYVVESPPVDSLIFLRTFTPFILAMTTGPLVGLSFHMQNERKIPTNEALYIDQKIEDFYR